MILYIHVKYGFFWIFLRNQENGGNRAHKHFDPSFLFCALYTTIQYMCVIKMFVLTLALMI